MDFLKVVELHELLRSTSPSPTLLHYFCRPRLPVNSFDSDACYKGLLGRKTLGTDSVGLLHFAPQDASIFQMRFEFIASNNDAYNIATKPDLTVEDLERFSYIKPKWSILFPIKLYLIDRPKLARDYRGLLPMGSKVFEFFKKIGKDVTKDDFTDHVMAKTFTNYYADLLGMPTITINSWMWLD